MDITLSVKYEQNMCSKIHVQGHKTVKTMDQSIV